MNGAYKLPLTFDVAGLLADLSSLKNTEWRAHYKQYHFDGEWAALALRSVSGEIHDLSSGPSNAKFRATPLLGLTPHIAELLASFHTPLRRVRLMRLAAGSEIKEHIDSYWAVTDEVRLHIPIETDPLVEFRVNGQSVTMKPGECWYLDVNSPHAVFNRSARSRIHLVIDCEVGPWIREVMPGPLPFERRLWGIRFMSRSVQYRRRDLAERARLQKRSQLGVLANLAVRKLRRRLNS